MFIYNTKHIGTTFTTNKGYLVEVVAGSYRPRFMTIRIDDWTKEVGTDTLITHSINYPYQKSCRGVGYTGEPLGPAVSPVMLAKATSVWRNMLTRVYSKAYAIAKPSYAGLTVCEEWWNMQVFVDWFCIHYKEGWVLDKDLLSSSEKTYSPTTCCFIPAALNSFIANAKRNNTSGHIGVAWHKRDKRWEASISINAKPVYLGRFVDVEKAVETYKKARFAAAQDLKVLYRNILPTRVVEAIR